MSTMQDFSHRYLTKKEAMRKYPFLTEDIFQNFLFKETGVVKKLGNRIFLDEIAFLRFLSERREYVSR